ncbi:MAG: DUF4258 domain-containing protein [Candidatus Omnitrophica bacterium]|nr:DUF4258 domain-containing protein [Candidatus Omnitrophota bacterium]MBU0878414.1 DUF4258 domain-containing protein [Candidatus Omnitrophota bacterium]
MDIVKFNNIRERLQNNQFELSWHAEKEKQQDKITYFEIDEAIKTSEVIEDYPDDPRGNSCLALGFTYEHKPIHFVLGNLEEEKILIITMYRPKLEEWIDFRIRRHR